MTLYVKDDTKRRYRNKLKTKHKRSSPVSPRCAFALDRISKLFKLQEKKNSKGEISKASKEDKCSGLRLYFTSSFSSSVEPGETHPHVVRPLSKAVSVPSRICRPASTRPSRNSIASGFPLTSVKRRVREIGRQEKGGRLRVWVFLQLSNCPNLFSLRGVPGHLIIEVTSGWSSTPAPFPPFLSSKGWRFNSEHPGNALPEFSF